MKKIIIFLFVSLTVCLQISLYGQTTVDITGTIKSPQGALQGAEITFLSINDEFQGNCISGPDGKFRSQYKFQLEKKIKIKITHKDYDDFEKIFPVEKGGNAGEFMLQRKMLTISGFVKDSIEEIALKDAAIFFYDGARLIQSKSTNGLGYFELETNFTYGQIITIRVSMSGYYDKEQPFTFTSEGRNTLQPILLPHIGDRGLRAFIKVRDKKNGKSLGGAAVRYSDTRKSTRIDTVVSSRGELELKLYQRPGTKIILEISKPNYRTINATQTLNEDPFTNEFIYEMERDRRSAVGPALLIGTGVCALAGGGMYLSSNSKYNNYKDFGNVNRESDFNSAQSSRTIAIVAGGIAAGAIITYVIYRIDQKNKEKDRELRKVKTVFQHFGPLHQLYAQGNMPMIGLAYQF